jgi:hypothetical protein
MRKDPKILIEHILERIGLIEEYLARKQGRISSAKSSRRKC